MTCITYNKMYNEYMNKLLNIVDMSTSKMLDTIY